jgi:hypothetical protein
VWLAGLATGLGLGGAGSGLSLVLCACPTFLTRVSNVRGACVRRSGVVCPTRLTCEFDAGMSQRVLIFLGWREIISARLACR